MTKPKPQYIILAFFLLSLGISNAYNNLGGGVCECDSCFDCTSAMNAVACTNIKLTANSYVAGERCIDGADPSNKIFNCQGHTIGGNDASYGVFLNSPNNITIRDCNIINFANGIYLSQGTGHSIINNTIFSHVGRGIIVQSGSSGNIIRDNFIHVNGWGITIESSNNVVSNTHVANNTQIGLQISGTGNNFTNVTASSNNVGVSVSATGNNFFNLNTYSNTINFQSSAGVTTNLTNYKLGSSTSYAVYPVLSILGTLNLGNAKVRSGTGFFSINSTTSDPLNSSANISITISNCSLPYKIYKKHGFPTSRDDILQNGTVYEPSWESCIDGVLTFEVDSFSGYGVQEPQLVDSAMRKVQHFEYGDHSKINYSTKGNFISEGGNITENNLTSNLSTEKWAGIYGTLQGTLSLGKNASTTTYSFYTWTISDVSGSKVCAQRDGTDFYWSFISSTTAPAVDNAWGFTSTDVDSVNSTYSTTCSNFKIAGTTVSSTIGVANVGNSASDFTNCAFDDGSTASKSHFAFCTVADTSGLVMDTIEADYALMLPTNEQDGQTETYDIFVQLA